jgi:(p)ppGpp synthase/HD superfamily hydrolase
MSVLKQEVLLFATSAHKNQLRKYTNEPYIVHPIEVAEILLHNYPQANENMLSAALLHDTVEDTETTLEEIEYKFGIEVAELVKWLTDVSRPEDGNRATRKALDRDHITEAPFEAQMIKTADLISNTTSILEHDINFARVYVKEKRLLLECMRETVKQTSLWKAGIDCLVNAESAINSIDK